MKPTPATEIAIAPTLPAEAVAVASAKHARATSMIARSTAPAAGDPGTANRLMVRAIGS